MPVYFSELESKDRTGQKNCDLLIIEKNASTTPEKALKLYIDIKTFTTFSAEHCRFSLIHANKKNLIKYISDMCIMISNYITKNPSCSEKIRSIKEQLKEKNNEL